MNYNYIKRNNNEFKLITDKEIKTNSTTNLLKQRYNYILQSMKKENYNIEYDNFGILQEIIDDNKVVGIISFICLESFDNSLCINEVYILPEHRKKGLFYQTLLNLLSQPNIRISLNNPNRKIINLLIKYEFAKKLDNNLVISYIDFYVNYSKRYVNKNIEEYYKLFEKENQKNLIKSNFYDLNINSCIFFDFENILNFNENPAFIEKARNQDSIKEKYFLKLKNVDITYLEVLLQRFLNVDKEMENLSILIENRINQYLNVDDILGNDYELTQIFTDILQQYHLTKKDGYKIRKSIIEALERNEIIPKSIILRTIYLMEHLNQIDIRVNDEIILGNDIEEECPYCLTKNFNFSEVCKVCGYNIQRNNNFEENLPQIIGNNFICNHLIPDYLLKEKIDTNQNKLSDIILNEIKYIDYDEKDVYETQCKIATYQLLKDIKELVYFDVIDYDSLNNIRQGSTYSYAKKHKLIKSLNDYHLYYEVMEIFFSDDELRNILSRNNLDTNGQRENLIFRIESKLSPKDIFGKKYSLTKKGFKFLEKNKNYEYYNENLSEFNFYEVINFKKHYKGNLKDFDKSFIKYLEEISIMNEDYLKYHDIIHYQLENVKKDSVEYLILFSKLFIIEINYWLNRFEHEKGEKPLDSDLIDKYPDIKDFFKYNDIVSIFNEANNSIKIDYLKDKNDKSLFYLIKSLNYDDIEDINREIEQDFFEENYLKSLLNE